MTTPPDDALLFDVDVSVPPTPVGRLLALADLYTQHNDKVDLLLFGRAADPDPSDYAASARRLERETLAAIKAIQDQRLRASDTVTDAVVRLKQLAYLSGGATRYLTAAQQTLPPADTANERPDPRRGLGQYARLARELTALAPREAVECAARIAGEMRRRRPAATAAAPVDELDPEQRSVLLEVACGHIAVARDLGRQHVYFRYTFVGVEELRRLDAEDLIARESASAPPSFRGGLPRDRVRLTARGIATLGALIEPPPTLRFPPAARPVPTAASQPAAGPSASTGRSATR
ncbi:hypothetical protein AB0L75_28435 [Streptomyces sp. NPDC052101]|uniref:hypothetical protein n=1 Tax=Streptomyces sp. NPDC052101 TaxID=3155763 RepID=UPI00342C92D5